MTVRCEKKVSIKDFSLEPHGVTKRKKWVWLMTAVAILLAVVEELRSGRLLRHLGGYRPDIECSITPGTLVAPWIKRSVSSQRYCKKPRPVMTTIAVAIRHLYAVCLPILSKASPTKTLTVAIAKTYIGPEITFIIMPFGYLARRTSPA
ncbi:hypothetical protein J7T55_013542 [Diaporthe amygdali]|uniref:uncharacterized protein n=1 Tax=Phomopsis amygdali TaxID=1214568 RepID=UPI0022FEA342|nr:uncharacterized protein J7T55_013542 [Diaporthe amygdali]KAJ0119304.1 hypothetical protein J7T55_013542 [Diaporthe amygdali]